MYPKVINTKSRVRTNPLGPPEAGTVQTETEFQVEALIVDVIVNEKHSDYSRDGYNVGCVKFRVLKTQSLRSDSKLNWAYPLDANITEFPLKNEIVLIFKSLNRYYYTRKLNLGNGPTHQAFFGLAAEMGEARTNQTQIRANVQSEHTPINSSQIQDALGTYFKDTQKLNRLRHWEGDLIIEGRSGHSIRFGTSWRDERIHDKVFQATQEDQSPLLIFRVGQNPNSLKTTNNYAGRVTEDINSDKTSVWMATDLVIPLEISTRNFKFNARSVRDYPSLFSGNQFVINTDRFILNTKQDKILIHSGRGFHVVTLQDATTDVERDYVATVGRDYAFEIIRGFYQNVAYDSKIWIGSNNTIDTKGSTKYTSGQEFDVSAGKKLSLIAPKIFIGSLDDSTEPMVLGKTLTDLLVALIDVHVENAKSHVTTPTGPGVLNPAIVTELKRIRGLLTSKTILSDDNFINKQNTEAKSVPDREPIHPRK